MKNALIFFYNIYIDSLEKLNDNYYFLYQNNNYVLAVYNRNIDDVNSIYKLNVEMLQNGLNTYQIILTNKNNLLFYEENNYYILMRMPKLKNKIININDILSFNYDISNLKLDKLDKSLWPFYWEKKIDYIEYQFRQISKKYNNLNNTINYYIGIWENAISYYNDNVILDNKKFICHKRLTVNTDLLDFLNPLNLVIDYKERDIGEYLKSYIYEEKYSYENLNLIFSKLSHNRNDVLKLISRLLFPSIYFDMYENIIFDKTNDDKILDIDNKYLNYEKFLLFVFNYYNSLNIPIVEWIINKKN